ncbi:unnamed protein product [Prorocentrum cordatum]|uniref:Uncharacterized protein n=1 Tax=Prorocentrum cordatum TaxID=2364126 RepID=A0ABN9XKR8_9DINO|nr:unnamed protein product [Polarella glacialis]
MPAGRGRPPRPERVAPVFLALPAPTPQLRPPPGLGGWRALRAAILTGLFHTAETDPAPLVVILWNDERRRGAAALAAPAVEAPVGPLRPVPAAAAGGVEGLHLAEQQRAAGGVLAARSCSCAGCSRTSRARGGAPAALRAGALRLPGMCALLCAGEEVQAWPGAAAEFGGAYGQHLPCHRDLPAERRRLPRRPLRAARGWQRSARADQAGPPTAEGPRGRATEEGPLAPPSAGEPGVCAVAWRRPAAPDLLHGVKVFGDGSRYSMIVWFAETAQECADSAPEDYDEDNVY